MFAKTTPIPITGMSFISSLGSTLDALDKNLSAQKRGLTFEHRFKDLLDGPLGEVQFNTAGILTSQDILANQVYCSIQSIAKETKVFEKYHPSEIGIFLGTSTAETFPLMAKIDRMFADKSLSLSSYLTQKDSHGFVAKIMKDFFPIAGLDLTFVTACSSTATAVAEGFYALNAGLLKACFVGGFDVLNPLTVCGFDALQILDHSLCLPFTKQRKGINLAEGGGLFLLENNAQALSDENIYAFVLGAGGSSDAYHMTKPDPSGLGQKRSMQKALDSCNMSAEKIDYINAHGTGTLSNDAAEACAIANIFGNKTPVSSTKTYHGHALGGSGAIELAVCIAALQNQKIWCGISSAEEYESNDTILHADKSALKKPLRTILSNSFGFGGSNMSLIIGKNAQ